VVPVSVSSVLLGDVRTELQRRSRALVDQGEAARGFLEWIAPTAVEGAPSGLRQSAARASALSGAQRTVGSVATMGFAAVSGVLDAPQTDALRSGVAWIIGRKLRVADAPTALLTDPVSVLGIALGARALADPPLVEQTLAWIRHIGEASAQLSGAPEWRRALLAVAAVALGGAFDEPLARNADLADVRLALMARGLLPTPTHEAFEADAARVIEQVRASEVETLNPVRAAARTAALEWIFSNAPIAVPGRMNASDIGRVLRRVPAGLRMWTWEKKGRARNALPRQWHVDHEYHVQNMLHVMLAPLFADLIPEENLRSIGQKHPRPDLCIPSLRVVIEVKFIRDSTPFAKVIEEVAADSSLYFGNGSPYEDMIVFAWDESRRDQEHDAFARGVRSLPHVVDAIVVSRPGSWESKDM